ncbi:hypothetical protein JXM83_06395 [Candidatus Woesearchaeota archaeon]|nr:hypothetical protein [Candidatus Woesearchaeota archaeon]
MPDQGFSLGTYHKHFKFDKKEVAIVLIVALVIGFITSFTKWGSDATPDVVVGLSNLFISTIISLVILLMFISVTKFTAIKRGYDVKIETSPIMIFISIMVSFISYGVVWFFPIMGLSISHNKKLRLGMFRYEANLKEMSMISFVGPFAILLMSFFFKIFMNMAQIDSFWFAESIKIATFLAVYTMLPLPKMNGLHIIFDSREKYFMYFGTIIGLSLSVLLIDNLLLALVIAIIFSGLFFWLGMKLLEKIA